METKAGYVAVGAFVLALVAVGLGFVVWLAKVSVDQSFDYYDIYFAGSVSGLREGGIVQYHGVPVGTVTTIEIVPEDVERVRVTIEVEAGTPVRADVIATLQIQGITGLSFVQLQGGSNASPMLAAKEGERYPVIASRPSGLERVFETVPELVARFTTLVERATVLLSDENQQAFAETLDNVRDLTGALSGQTGNIEATLTDARTAVGALRDTAVEVRGMSAELRVEAKRLADAAEKALAQITVTAATADTQVSAISGELQTTLKDCSDTADSLTRLADDLDGMVGENRQPLRTFSETGLYELSQFITEARALVGVLTQIASQVERDPTRFLLGGQQQGYEAQ
jgi:phospholipid/cholesterol/gamma-HCH transport system substrate-binding protein